jgi:DNA-binding transcriptional MerR regulator
MATALASDWIAIGEVAEHFGVKTWMVRRVFERGIVPEPRRVGPFRVFQERDFPAIEKALRECGYLRAD